jgi:hypothetical protein
VVAHASRRGLTAAPQHEVGVCNDSFLTLRRSRSGRLEGWARGTNRTR